MTHAVPTREDGLKRLEEFLPLAGRDYAELRNHVPGVVSGLAPYVRTRLLTEEEITCAVLKRHSYKAAEKFLQEVCWRTYWKGWLEMRPEVWLNYLQDLQTLRGKWDADSDARNRLQAAERGETGLECMDAWVKELKETGYLHNHVRMWFASIWVHTLRLPWQLGADFFMRHLLDGDPASNTLSWRWVCGLQTRGKVYRATGENIAKFTGGRFQPTGLDCGVDPPIATEEPIPPPDSLAPMSSPPKGTRLLLMSTVEDLTPEQWGIDPADVTGIVLVDARIPGASEIVTAFRKEALLDASRRAAAFFGAPVTILDSRNDAVPTIPDALSSESQEILLMTPSVGLLPEEWMRTLSAQVPIRRFRRKWDSEFWPHATHGFFRFREQIPSVLGKFA